MNDYDTPEIRCSVRNLSRVTEWDILCKLVFSEVNLYVANFLLTVHALNKKYQQFNFFFKILSIKPTLFSINFAGPGTSLLLAVGQYFGPLVFCSSPRSRWEKAEKNGTQNEKALIALALGCLFIVLIIFNSFYKNHITTMRQYLVFSEEHFLELFLKFVSHLIC